MPAVMHHDICMHKDNHNVLSAFSPLLVFLKHDDVITWNRFRIANIFLEGNSPVAGGLPSQTVNKCGALIFFICY